MARNQLSEVKVRRARRRTKPYKLYDGDGLYLLVHPNGSRYWRIKYRIAGKERLYAVGLYPDVAVRHQRL